MTKFERAKKQTLKRWDDRISLYLGITNKLFEACGFCVAYPCSGCPIALCSGYKCFDRNGPYAWLTLNDLPNIWAVLIYVHQLQDPDL